MLRQRAEVCLRGEDQSISHPASARRASAVILSRPNPAVYVSSHSAEPGCGDPERPLAPPHVSRTPVRPRTVFCRGFLTRDPPYNLDNPQMGRDCCGLERCADCPSVANRCHSRCRCNDPTKWNIYRSFRRFCPVHIADAPFVVHLGHRSVIASGLENPKISSAS